MHYYLYNRQKPGIEQVEEMIVRATNDKELNTFITQIVKDSYADKRIAPKIATKVKN